MSFLDTLASAFKGGGEVRVPLARGFISPWALAYDRSGGSQPFDYNEAIRAGFIANPIAQRAVRIVAEGVGRAPLSISDDQVASLVNATSAGQPLIETLTAHLLLHGNGYVQIIKDGSGTPVELFALRPERMNVVAGPDGWPCGYEYRVGTSKLTIGLEDDNGWPEVVHIKAMHPVIEGMSDTPPTAPVEGDTWLVAATANGVWSGQEDKLASYIGSQWLFISPQAGMRVFLRNSSQFYLYDNAWMGASEPAVPNGGTTVDVEARDAIADLIEVLRVSGILAQP